MDYVIDTNYLRTPANPAALNRPDLGQLLASSAPNDRFILTDTAIIEQMKNAQWESTARASFRIISQHPQKIWLAKAPGDLMQGEIDTGRETAELIDLPLSEGFRVLLQEIAGNASGPAMAHARTTILAAQADLAQQQQNHVANLQALTLACTDIRGAIDIAGYRRIPDPNQKDLVRLHRVKTLAQTAVRRLLELERRPASLGQTLAYGCGILLRYHIGLYCLGFKWALNGTLSPDPTRATNELMDLNHALIASYCDDILTEEASVREMRRDIVQAIHTNIQFAPASAAPN